MRNPAYDTSTVRVFNLDTGTYYAEYVGCSPAEAVIASYAQSNGDWNTWEYAERYSAVTLSGSVSCGSFCAVSP